ncbi:roadblock/LC7 domain-containing protein [Thermobifida alba]|jgi:predicted regulator of Ras-like GTPase activity (Roadblock/LC7/MglB family)|uniref:Roadblock/LC7 domain-containing protein n=1 Tax=Thermobifida alba TaxID=53522 RepID=A0ABY4L218_THEAE|nr:roadblock/LC7 domain-containing protein [Thermobifida alba]UPT21524.1 roadblock/LC7 domain-containing protein [Thermobifida alba]
MDNRLSESAENFTWLVSNFVSEVPGAEHAIVVSSDGLLLTASRGFPEEHAEQLAAIVSGLQSLAEGTARMFAKGDSEQLILRMKRGYLFVMSISDGSSLAVLTSKDADMKIVAYQMTLLVENAGHVLTPQLRSELREVIR